MRDGPRPDSLDYIRGVSTIAVIALLMYYVLKTFY